MKLKFVRATINECLLLYIWANDENVRENAFNSNKINFEDHCKWFYSKINDINVKIFILYRDDIPIGQVRVELRNNEGFIDYSIDKLYRNNGYGKLILKNIEYEMKKDKSIYELIGEVKFNNNQSQKCFEKLGYLKEEKEDHIKYRKALNSL